MATQLLMHNSITEQYNKFPVRECGRVTLQRLLCAGLYSRDIASGMCNHSACGKSTQPAGSRGHTRPDQSASSNNDVSRQEARFQKPRRARSIPQSTSVLHYHYSIWQQLKCASEGRLSAHTANFVCIRMS